MTEFENLSPHDRSVVLAALDSLVPEHEGLLDADTVEAVLVASWETLAERARIKTFLPLMAERFARQRLKALVRIEHGAGEEPIVLFLCVHNAGRSQMAAAFLNALADPHRARAVSAGTHPAEHIHPVVVDAMREVGIDLTASRPQLLTEAFASRASLLVTMGCGDECPYVPGIVRDDWPFDDPKDRPLTDVRRIRDDIKNRVTQLVHARGWARPPE